MLNVRRACVRRDRRRAGNSAYRTETDAEPYDTWRAAAS